MGSANTLESSNKKINTGSPTHNSNVSGISNSSSSSSGDESETPSI